MEIRKESPADVAAIYQVHAAAFPTEAEAKLVNALRTAGRLTISLVAMEKDQLLGHVALSPVRVNMAATNGLGLAPIAVHPEHQQRGIGTELMHAAIAAAKDRTVGFIVVLGDPVFYRRFGFLPASRHNLNDEYGGGDAFQAVEWIVGSIPPGGGTVQYAPEFASLG